MPLAQRVLHLENLVESQARLIKQLQPPAGSRETKSSDMSSDSEETASNGGSEVDVVGEGAIPLPEDHHW